MSITENQHETSEFVVETPTEFARMELAAGEWNSIYIPYLSNQLVLMNHYDVVHPFLPKYLRDFLEKVVRIGKVRRIDFVDRDVPSSTVPVKAAFVHFEYWYDTPAARNLREKLNTYGQYRQKGYIYKGKRCNFYQSMTTYQDGTIRPGYFDIRINHKPIEETDCDRNIHQLYAENLLLERELAERNARIEELQSELEHIRSMITIGPNTQMDYATDDDAQVNTDVDAAEMNKTVSPDTKEPMTMAEWEGNRTIAQLS